MGINMVDRLIVEHTADDGIRLARLRKGRIDHHSIAVKGTERKDASVERGWNFILVRCCLSGSLADEDGVAGPVGVIAVVRDVIDKQQRLSRLRVIQLNPAREAWLTIGGHPDRAMKRELLVAKSDEMLKRRWV